MHKTFRIKRVSIKSLDVLKCFVRWVSDGQLARTVLQKNNGALVGFALKNVHEVNFLDFWCLFVGK